MAIWDSDEGIIERMTDTGRSIKCPSCGTSMFFDAKFGKLMCHSCGSAFDPQTMELSYRLEKRDQEKAGEEDSSNHEIVCNTCGAIVVTDRNTSATFCAFCGSPTLITRRLEKQFRPDVIIPFKVTKEEAKAKFKEFASKKRYTPSSFKDDATLSKMTGLYVPFWLIDGVCHVDVKGEGKKHIGQGTYHTNTVDLEYKFRVKNVPFDGSHAISDRLMEAIEPFDYRDLKPFSNSYLPGFYAERYNLSVTNMLERISRRLDVYAGDYAKKVCIGYDEFNITENFSYTDGLSQKYALMPVWFLNYEYEGGNYSFAVNGQTGEVDGDMPVSKWKARLRKALFLSVILAPVAALVIFLIVKIITYLNAIAAFFAAIVPFTFFFICMFAASRHSNRLFDFQQDDRGFSDFDLFTKFFGSIFRPIRDKFDDISNETVMVLDEAPEVEQYAEMIPGEKPKIKESVWIKTRHDF